MAKQVEKEPDHGNKPRKRCTTYSKSSNIYTSITIEMIVIVSMCIDGNINITGCVEVPFSFAWSDEVDLALATQSDALSLSKYYSIDAYTDEYTEKSIRNNLSP